MFLGSALLGLTALYAGQAFAAPTVAGDVTIDTNANIIINQVVATVTVAGCDAAPTSAAIGSGLVNGGQAGTAAGAQGSSPAIYGAPGGDSTSGKSPVVLRPVAPSCEDVPHASQVMPQSSATLYYGTSPTIGLQAQGPSAVVTIPQLTYPAVNAWTASAITSVVCNGNQATVSFASSQAYNQAASTWSKSGPFTLITYSNTCGTGLDGTHDFILVQTIVSTLPSGSSIVVTIQLIDLEQAIGSNTTVTVQIGGNSTITGANNGTSTTNSTCVAGSFDQSLDASLGSPISLTNAANWARVVPGVAPTDIGNVDDLPALSRRDAVIERRFWGSITKAFQKIAEPFKAIPKVIPQVFKSVEDLAKDAINKLDKFTTISKSLDKNVAFNKYITNGGSPFGDAYKVYSNDKLQVYCVGCGADGSFTVSGTVDFSIANGFKSGRVSANGKLNSGVVFGIVGQAGFTIPFPEQTFAQVSLGDLVVPGFLKLGPTARIGAGGSITLDAAGQLQAGAKLSWPAVQATVDVIGSSSSVTGWKPDINPVFSANGQISTTLDAHLTAAIGFTIGILDNKFSKSVELVDQPGIQVTAGAQGSASFNNGKFSGGFTGDCKGVAISAKFYNNLFADVAGVKKYNLFNYVSDPLSRCITTPTKREIEAPVYRRQTNTTALTNATSLTNYPVPRNSSTASNVTTPDASFSILTSEDGLFGLHWSTNGNIYAITSNGTTATAGASGDDSDVNTSDETGLFGTSAGTNSSKPVIVGDATGRAFNVYTNELSQYGVSRLRLHLPDSMPPTALLVAFMGVADPDGGPDVIAALDTNGTAYYPILCAYPSCYPKIFLAKDADAGASALQNLPALTGASGLACSYIPLEGDGDTEGF